MEAGRERISSAGNLCLLSDASTRLQIGAAPRRSALDNSRTHKTLPYRASASIACAAAFSLTSSSQALVVTSSEGSLAPPHPPWLHARTLYLNPRPGTRWGMLTGWEVIVGYHGGNTGAHDEFPRRSPLASSL